METTFINSMYTENTGGGVMCDFITLTDGKLMVISVDMIGIYDNMDSFNNGDNPISYIER
jgi:hypothetical protein